MRHILIDSTQRIANIKMISFCRVKFLTRFNFFPISQEAMQSRLGLKAQKDPKLVKFALITSSNRHELFTIRSLGIEGGHVINSSWDIDQQVVLKEWQIWRQSRWVQLKIFHTSVFFQYFKKQCSFGLKSQMTQNWWNSL